MRSRCQPVPRGNSTLRQDVRFGSDFIPFTVTHQPDAYVLQSRLILGIRQVSHVERHITAVATFISICGRPHIEMGVYVVRAFVRLREFLVSNRTLMQKLDELERKLRGHDQTIVGILRTLRELTNARSPNAVALALLQISRSASSPRTRTLLRRAPRPAGKSIRVRGSGRGGPSGPSGRKARYRSSPEWQSHVLPDAPGGGD